MATASRSKSFDVAAETMWGRMGDFQSPDKWHPAIAGTESLEGGKVRDLTLGDGAHIRETLLDQGDRSYTYRIDESPLPVKDYSATIRVRESGADSCAIEWDAEFEPAGVEEAEAVAVVEGIFQTGLDAL